LIYRSESALCCIDQRPGRKSHCLGSASKMFQDTIHIWSIHTLVAPCPVWKPAVHGKICINTTTIYNNSGQLQFGKIGVTTLAIAWNRFQMFRSNSGPSSGELNTYNWDGRLYINIYIYIPFTSTYHNIIMQSFSSNIFIHTLFPLLYVYKVCHISFVSV